MMAEIEWFQRYKALNYHSDIVLRTPILAGFKVPVDSFNSIMGIAYPEYGRIIPDCIEDLRRNALRNILAMSNVRSLNGLFGLKSCASI